MNFYLFHQAVIRSNHSHENEVIECRRALSVREVKELNDEYIIYFAENSTPPSAVFLGKAQVISYEKKQTQILSPEMKTVVLWLLQITDRGMPSEKDIKICKEILFPLLAGCVTDPQ